MRYFCSVCKRTITEDEYEYSMDKYRRALCRPHQKRPEIKPQPPTPEALKLYQALKKRGVPATLEKFDGFKHIDIAIPQAKVNIEVDGGQHNFDHKQALADLKRTFYSFKKGYVTLRIPNSLVREHLEETADYITDFLNESLEQLEEDEDIFSKIFGF